MKRVHHFAVLDGMRGIAAIAVAYFHSAALFGLPSTAHIELSVDFFFCLSGFVVAHAYDQRLRDGMPVQQLLQRRLIRLHPLVVAGVILGLIVTAIGCATNNGVFIGQPYTTKDLLIGSGLCLFLLPAGMVLSKMFYFVDSPLWSLFFEYIANLGYALTRGRKGSLLASLLVLGSLFCVLLYVAVAAQGVVRFGLGNVALFLAGLARLAFPFFAGMLISRFTLYLHVPRVPELGLMAVFLVFLACPFFEHTWQYDMFGVAILVPAFICLGAQASTTDGWLPTWQYLGRISYPLYVLHMPVLKAVAQTSTVAFHNTVPAPVELVIALGLSWGLAEIALRYYDGPVRAWLADMASGTRKKSTDLGRLPDQGAEVSYQGE